MHFEFLHELEFLPFTLEIQNFRDFFVCFSNYKDTTTFNLTKNLFRELKTNGNGRRSKYQLINYNKKGLIAIMQIKSFSLYINKPFFDVNHFKSKFGKDM